MLPQPTYLPLATGLATAAAVLGCCSRCTGCRSRRRWWSAFLFVLAAQRTGHPRDLGLLPIGRGASVPPHTEVDNSPPWIALLCTLVVDGTLFTSLLFGTLYVWIGLQGTPPVMSRPDVMLVLAVFAALVLAVVAARKSLGTLAGGAMPLAWIGLAMAALIAAIAAAVGLISDISPSPTDHALGATSSALMGFVIFHAFVGLLFLLSNLLRIRGGYVSARRRLDLRLTRLWVDYTAATGVIALALMVALPSLVGLLKIQP